jgi:hypothetical protein
MADDPTNHRLFLDRTLVDFSVDPIAFTNQLVTIDSVTGAVSASPLDHALTGLVFDPSTGTLFGFTAECCPAQIVTVDPGTGVETHVADLAGESFSFMALAPSSHSIYLDAESFVSLPPTNSIATVSTANGAVSQSANLSTGVRSLAFDSSNGSLFGITFGQPQFVRIDPSAGTETAVGAYDFGTVFVGPGTAVDPATHTVFLIASDFDPVNGLVSHITTINDQTGAGVQGASTGTSIAAIAFEPSNAVPNLQADLQAATASGAIDDAGVARALLAEAKAASAAKQCSVAARIYQSFINNVKAQSGKHIAPATAALLIGEAKFLIANCP